MLAAESPGATTAGPAASHLRSLGRLVDLLAPLGLFGLAFAVRWPNYLVTPAFTDEAREVTRAALIAQGRLQTLTNVDPYISSLFNYLLAGLFTLFGPRLELPRLFVLVVGCLTVVAAYLLGRAWGGRSAGLIAGALLATNPVHVLVNSHIAYSNCITPLFTTLGLWALSRAGGIEAGVRRVPGASSSRPAGAELADAPPGGTGSSGEDQPFEALRQAQGERALRPFGLSLSKGLQTGSPALEPGLQGSSGEALSLEALRQAQGERVLRPFGLSLSKGLQTASPALEPGRGRVTHFALAGLLFGLALLTHPAVLTLLPGCAIFVLWRLRSRLQLRGLLVAAALFTLAYSPLIVYNLLNGFRSLDVVEQTRSVDQQARVLDLPIYLRNLGGYAQMLVRSLAGAIDQRAGGPAQLLDPLVPIWLVAGLAALWLLARRGNLLPTAIVPSALLLSALFSASSFEPIIPGRYVLPIVVVVQAALGAALVALFEGRRARGATLLAGLAVGALVLLPLRSLVAYDERRPFDNQALLAAGEALEAARAPGEEVLIDQQLATRRGGIGARLDELVTMALAVRGIPYRQVDLERELPAAAAQPGGVLVALDGDSLPRLRDRYAATRLAPLLSRPERFDQPRHAVYRLTAGS